MAINRVIIKKKINVDMNSVWEWFYHSENFIKSPIVFQSTWRKNSTKWTRGSVRDILMIAGWYQEEITDIKTNEYIRYRVVKSFPSVRQDFTEIHFTKLPDKSVELKWTIDIEVPVPVIGKYLTKFSGKMAGILYSTIINAGKKRLEKVRN